MPVLDKIIISGFKNIGFQELAFSSGINCITGDNGEGKTNLIDAIYYLSMTKSAFSQSDKFNSLNGCGKFSLSGLYSFENGLSNRYSVSVSEAGKTVKVNDKVYERLSDHIGVLPIVLVSPNDVSLVNGFGEERRKFMNAIISQLDKDYLKAHQPLLVDGRFHYDRHMTFAGMARPFHALDEMGYIIGGFDGLLPYGKEIDRCATEGGMFQAIKYCNPKYTASLNKVLDALEQMELAEQAAEDADDEDEFEEDDADE